jgi:hypothetical protein
LLIGVNANTKESSKTIHAWPTNMTTMSGILCDVVKRNMTKDEWDTYVDENLEYERTCTNHPKNDQ